MVRGSTAYASPNRPLVERYRGRTRYPGGPQAALPKGTEMDRQVTVVLYVVAMVVLIVGVDVAFFRGRFWERLMVNVGMVLVFGAFYLRFLGRS